MRRISEAIAAIGIRGRILVVVFAASAPGVVLATFMSQQRYASARTGLRPGFIGDFTAGLDTLAPLISVTLAVIAAWALADIWVLSSVRKLAALVTTGVLPHDGGLASAPRELKVLGEAFDAIMLKGVIDQRALDQSTQSNASLTRDLHHYVKNNMQVQLSLLTRQQQRATDASAHRALAESRSRMLAIALAQRFLDSQDYQGKISLEGFLAELTAQVHLLLFPQSPTANPHLAVDPTLVSVERASAIGLMVVEILVVAARSGIEGLSVDVTWLKTTEGEGVLSAEANIHGVPVATDPDVDLLKLIARQAGANPMIGPGARILARFPGGDENTG